MIRTVRILYKNLDLTIKGYHSRYRSGDRDQPASPESFEMDKIYLGDCDVTTIFDTLLNDWCEMEELCLEELRD